MIPEPFNVLAACTIPGEPIEFEGSVYPSFFATVFDVWEENHEFLVGRVDLSLNDDMKRQADIYLSGVDGIEFCVKNSSPARAIHDYAVQKYGVPQGIDNCVVLQFNEDVSPRAEDVASHLMPIQYMSSDFISHSALLFTKMVPFLVEVVTLIEEGTSEIAGTYVYAQDVMAVFFQEDIMGLGLITNLFSPIVLVAMKVLIEYKLTMPGV